MSTTLSTVEFEVCWATLELGELPLILDLPSLGRTAGERESIVDHVLAAIGTPPPELASLSRFDWAVDARIITTRLVRARAAVTGEHGVLAVLDGERVTVERLPGHAALSALTALAGDAPTGRADSVSVRADALDTAAAMADDDPLALAEGLIALGEQPADARATARLCQGAQRKGQFAGRPSNGAPVVAFHDTDTTRYLHVRRDGWVTFAPVGPGGLAAHVRHLVATPVR